MLHDNAHEYWEWKRKRDAERAAVPGSSERSLKDRNGDLRLAFTKALITSGGLAYFQARIAASNNPRAVYLETCAELGIEAAGID